MLNTQELRQATDEVHYPAKAPKETRTAEIKAYREEISRLEQQWKDWLAAEYLPQLSASKTDEVYRKAWEDGHSSGYQEVEYHYEELAVLINRIL